MQPSGFPVWAQIIGKCLPLHDAVNIINEIVKPDYLFSTTLIDFGILAGYIFILLILASLTLKDTE